MIKFCEETTYGKTPSKEIKPLLEPHPPVTTIAYFKIEAKMQVNFPSDKCEHLKRLYYSGTSEKGLLSEVGYNGSVCVTDYAFGVIDDKPVCVFDLMSSFELEE